jgi:hypothetical protein
MKAIQGYHLIEPKDLFWRPSNLMQIANADYLQRTGSENIGARLWHLPPKSADSDQFGHLFQKYSDSVPGYSDSCRSVATLWSES